MGKDIPGGQIREIGKGLKGKVGPQVLNNLTQIALDGRNGKSPVDIARKLGTSDQEVITALRALGITIKKGTQVADLSRVRDNLKKKNGGK